jgi:hypothetical protein
MSSPLIPRIRRLPGTNEALSARIDALERWQVAQNGTLVRIETKQDKLLMWMLGSMFTALLALAGIVITLLRH